MKKYIFLAASALALASCSSDDFLGDTPGSTPTSANSAIKFDGNAGKISRTSNTGSAADMLGNEFKVYGVKSGATSGTDYNPVFKDYLLWYDDANKNTTTNKSGWEYVGTAGTHGSATLNSNQTIKFWDYASADYRFVAGAPSSAFEFNPKTDENDKSIETATITGLGGHINANSTGSGNTFNPIYVAEPKVVAKANYKELVQFNFVRQQSMVRVGIYETIPGYKITEIKFYDADGSTATNSNIILTSATADYFVGGSNVSGTVTYNWETPTPSYTFNYTDNENLKKSKNWYAGKLVSGALATTSSEQEVATLYGTDNDMSTTGYFTVLPTQATTASPILIKCDYTLTADDKSGETIEVKGATAAIPAAYSKWNTNTRYTYLFKISENTNGYTGNDPNKTGLYPITFDAAVEAPQFGMEGTITTFTTPSITTHQEGSVVENSGIKYVTNKNIKVTITDNTSGETKVLSKGGNAEGNVAVYKLSQERTEADLQLASVSTEEIKSANSKDVTLATDNKSFTFLPNDAGYYAIQYLTTAADRDKPAAYTYKVVYVAAN